MPDLATPSPPGRARPPFEPRHLGDGLVLRAAGADDGAAVVALNVALFGEQDEPGVHDLLTGPLPVEWLVVADEGEAGAAPAIAAACARIPHRYDLDGVAVRGSQIEYVTTDPGYRRRGLVRALFAAHHERAAAEREQLQLIGGIPYFYRLLGYGYALDPPATVVLDLDRLAPAAPAGPGAAAPGVVREATADDLGWMAGLEADRRRDGLTIVRTPDTFASWLRRSGPLGDGAWESLLVAEAGGERRGWLRLQCYLQEGQLYLLPGHVPTTEVAEQLLARCATLAARLGDTLARPVQALAADLPGSPWSVALHRHGSLRAEATGVYGRTADPLGLLRTLAPVLERRLRASGLADDRGEVTISLYDRGIRLAWDAGRLTAVDPAEADPDPFDHGGVGVAPDWFPALVLGRWGATGLAERADDVLLGDHGPVLEVLFPPRPNDIATD